MTQALQTRCAESISREDEAIPQSSPRLRMDSVDMVVVVVVVMRMGMDSVEGGGDGDGLTFRG